MRAIIEVEVPDYQIEQEVSIYFKDTMMIKGIVQEPCEEEYIKVPKKALKYRTAGMVAYNAEWLKNHFDIERVVICGEQEPCGDAISEKEQKAYNKGYVDGLQMRDFTKEEAEAYSKALDKMYKPTGLNVNDLIEPCDDAISRQ